MTAGWDELDSKGRDANRMSRTIMDAWDREAGRAAPRRPKAGRRHRTRYTPRNGRGAEGEVRVDVDVDARGMPVAPRDLSFRVDLNKVVPHADRYAPSAARTEAKARRQEDRARRVKAEGAVVVDKMSHADSSDAWRRFTTTSEDVADTLSTFLAQGARMRQPRDLQRLEDQWRAHDIGTRSARAGIPDPAWKPVSAPQALVLGRSV